MSGKRILCVGLVTVDIVQICSTYPLEDSDQRCSEYYWQRGGNASNNCTVLSKLDAKCEYFGTIGGGLFREFLKNDFKSQKIVTENCVYYDDCDCPMSTVIINSQTGSRTIIHSNKNLPELTLEDFKKLDLSLYSWIHFEGRNIEKLRSMMAYAASWRSHHDSLYRLSLELEKPKLGQDILIDVADVLFVGKDYAIYKGYKSMQDTIESIRSSSHPEKTIISAWGEDGATGFSESEGLVFSPAIKQCKTIDTLGAGDTFCAAVIFALNKGITLKRSIKFGCEIAGAKVGIRGFSALKEVSDVYWKELQQN